LVCLNKKYSKGQSDFPGIINTINEMNFRSERVQVGLLAGTLLLAYLVSMPLTVTLEDSGLFLVCLKFLGINHPPGYPIYTVLGHLFTRIPFGSDLFNVQLLSALLGALTCFLFYFVLRELKISKISSLISTLALGLSDTFWGQTIIAEVYALNIFMFTLLLLLCLRFDGSKKSWIILSLVYGLSLCNHWPLIVLSSGTFLILLFKYRQSFAKNVGFVLLAFLAGLIPYLYILVRSSHSEILAFSGPVNSFGELIAYTFRNYYENDFDVAASIKDKMFFIIYFIKRLFIEYGYWGGPFLLYGMYLAYKRFEKSLFVSLLLSFLSSSVILLLLLSLEFNEAREKNYLVFLLVPFCIGAIYIAVALDEIGKRFREHKYALVSAALMGVSLSLFFGFKSNFRRNDDFASNYSKAVLLGLPVNSTLLIEGDADSGPILYSRLVEGLRADVNIYSQFGLYLPNRVFDPKSASTDAIKINLERLVKKNQDVYATYVGDDIGARNSISKYNKGIYWRLNDNFERRDQEKDNQVLAIVKETLDKAVKDQDKQKWPYLFNRIVMSLCGYLVYQNIEHEAFMKFPTCKYIKAEYLIEIGQYEQAVKLSREAYDEYESAPKQFKDTMLDQNLIAKIRLANNQKLPTPIFKEQLQPTFDEAFEFVQSYPSCGGRVLKHILEMSKQINFRIDSSWIRANLGHCQLI
jgi:hypothetical protein